MPEELIDLLRPPTLLLRRCRGGPIIRVPLEVRIMAKKKTAKPTIKKGHKIARAIKRAGRQGKGKGKATNAFAVGMAQAKKSAAKRKRARKG